MILVDVEFEIGPVNAVDRIIKIFFASCSFKTDSCPPNSQESTERDAISLVLNDEFYYKFGNNFLSDEKGIKQLYKNLKSFLDQQQDCTKIFFYGQSRVDAYRLGALDDLFLEHGKEKLFSKYTFEDAHIGIASKFIHIALTDVSKVYCPDLHLMTITKYLYRNDVLERTPTPGLVIFVKPDHWEDGKVFNDVYRLAKFLAHVYWIIVYR
jgi:hypothetical protein